MLEIDRSVSLIAKGTDMGPKAALNLLQNDDSIGVFDFDGVVISRSEEIVYQIPPSKSEEKYLTDVARTIGFPFQNFDIRYLRHILFQFALEKNSTPCQAGPMLSVLRSLSEAKAQFFILTARSAMPAIRRALNFLDAENISPAEIFFVGRVGKGQQLKLLDREFPENRLIYFDDSTRHSKNAGRMKSSKIDSFFVDWPVKEVDRAQKFYKDAMIDAFGEHSFWR